MNRKDAVYFVLDSKPGLSRLPKSHQMPHGTKGPMPSCRTLSGEKVPCSRGGHWKRCCPEAAPPGVKAFGRPWGECLLKAGVVASGARESVLPGQHTAAVNGLLFS